MRFLHKSNSQILFDLSKSDHWSPVPEVEPGWFNDVPIGHEPESRLKTLPQSGCLLFAKFPLEIRHLIYQELHLCDTQYVLRAFVKNGSPFSRRAKAMVKDGPMCVRDQTFNLQIKNENMTNMLRLCRRIYAEIIDLLYTSNAFYFTDTTALKVFTRQAHPLFLQRVRSIQLLFSYAGPPIEDKARVEWTSTWHELAGFKGLSHLTVTVGEMHMFSKGEHIIIGGDGMWPKSEADLLQDAAKIRNVEHFRLILSWEKGKKRLPKIKGVIERYQVFA